MTNYIWIKTQKEAMHYYPRAIGDIKYLSYPHRHIFFFKVYIEVTDNDREIEFHQFKKFINSIINEWKFDLKNTSCEMMATELYESICHMYKNKNIKIEISEDNENGVLMEFLKKN